MKHTPLHTCFGKGSLSGISSSELGAEFEHFDMLAEFHHYWHASISRKPCTSYKHTLTVYMRTAISLLAGCGCTNETCDSSRDRVRFEFTSCAWTFFLGWMQWIPSTISVLTWKILLSQNKIFSWQHDISHANVFNLRLEPLALQQLVVLGACSGFIKSTCRALIQTMRALQYLRPAIWMKFTEPRNHSLPAARANPNLQRSWVGTASKPSAMGNRSGVPPCYAHQSCVTTKRFTGALGSSPVRRHGNPCRGTLFGGAKQ